MTLFSDSLPFTLGVEAGYQCDHGDAGNWSSGIMMRGVLVGTNLGISAPMLAEWRGENNMAADITAADMRALSLSEATAIYGAKFWNKVRGDDLGPGLGLSTFDMQVNAGTVGSKCLQRAIGLAGDNVDGWIGGETLAAIKGVHPGELVYRLTTTPAQALQHALGLKVDGRIGPVTAGALSAHPSAVALIVCALAHDEQARFYKSLSSFREFGKGWLTRCADRLTAALRQITAQNGATA